eukprot:5781115-Amphidinium_carterae.1
MEDMEEEDASYKRRKDSGASSSAFLLNKRVGLGKVTGKNRKSKHAGAAVHRAQAQSELTGACIALGMSILTGLATFARRPKTSKASRGRIHRCQSADSVADVAIGSPDVPPTDTAICNLPWNDNLGDELEAGATGGAEEVHCIVCIRGGWIEAWCMWCRRRYANCWDTS